MHHGRVLIVIPTYNEAENIGELLQQLLTLYPDIHVLVVDDHSSDNTQDIVRSLQERHGERLFLLPRNGKNGRGSAVLDGFGFALDRGYDVVMEMDADFAHQPEDVALFLEKIDGYDFLTGSRYLPQSRMHHRAAGRKVISKLANIYARAVLGIPLSDYSNGFRAYSRRALTTLDRGAILSTGYVVLSEVAYQLHRNGMRIGEIPVTFFDRRRGTSNFGLHEIVDGFLTILKIRWHYAARTKRR